MITQLFLNLCNVVGRTLVMGGLAVCVGGALLRFGVWATGSAYMHADLQGPPQIVEWTMDDAWFGGMSALLMAPDGTSLLAGSDHGGLVEATVTRGPAEDLIGIENARLTMAKLRTGHAPTSFKMDLEGLSRDPAGGWLLAYESYVRIDRLAHVGARPVAMHRWEEFAGFFGNEAFEALATLPDGRVMAITEAKDDQGQATSVIWDSTGWQAGPDIPVSRGYHITGADVGPDGCLYLIERRYGVASGFTFGIRRLSGGPEAWEDTLLYRSAPARLGNGEGIGAWQNAAGQIMLSVITDNGFWPLTTTRLIEMRARPGQDCGVTF